MALLWLEGFETYGASSGSAPTNIATDYTVNGSTTNTILFTGRVGNLGLKINNAVGGSSIAPPTFGNVASWVIGFGFRPGDNLVDTRICSWYDGSTEQFTLRMTSGGELEVYRGSSSLLAASSGAVGLATNSWCYIEIKLTIGNSGSYDVHLNGVSVLADATEDTQQTSNAYAQTIRFWGVFNATIGNRTAFDDIYIADQTAGEVDDFVGQHKVVTFFPSSAGNDTDFTPSAGNNWECVDDNPYDGDTSYVESGTSGHRDTYNFTDATLTDILGVQMSVIARETDASPFSLKLVCESDGTADDGSGVAIGSTSYVNRRRVLEHDPDTSAAWGTVALNSAVFGIEVA